jgi:hypothetical protein
MDHVLFDAETSSEVLLCWTSLTWTHNLSQGAAAGPGTVQDVIKTGRSAGLRKCFKS